MKVERKFSVTVTYDDTSETAHVTGYHTKPFCVAIMKGRANLATKRYPANQNHDDYFKVETAPKESEITIVIYESR